MSREKNKDQYQYKNMLTPLQVYVSGVGLLEQNSNLKLVAILNGYEYDRDTARIYGELARVYKDESKDRYYVWAYPASEDYKHLAHLRVPHYGDLDHRIQKALRELKINVEGNKPVIYQVMGHKGKGIHEDHYVFSYRNVGEKKFEIDSKKTGTQGMIDGWSCGIQSLINMEFKLDGKSLPQMRISGNTLKEHFNRYKEAYNKMDKAGIFRDGDSPRLIDQDVVVIQIDKFEKDDSRKNIDDRLNDLVAISVEYFKSNRNDSFSNLNRTVLNAINKVVKTYKLQTVTDSNKGSLSADRRAAYEDVKATVNLMTRTFNMLNGKITGAEKDKVLNDINRLSQQAPKKTGFGHALAKWCGMAALVLLAVPTLGATAVAAYHFFKKAKRTEADAKLDVSKHAFTQKGNTFLSPPEAKQDEKGDLKTSQKQDQLDSSTGTDTNDDLLGFESDGEDPKA